jgi:mRNA-degrading endonuclease RelE of RelBE toxin-antitoxin system
MHIEATSTFVKLYKKLDPELKNQVKKALTLLQQDPDHPSLGHKKMAGHKDVYEIRVTKNYRITYTTQGDTAILRKLGTHDVLNNP